MKLCRTLRYESSESITLTCYFPIGGEKIPKELIYSEQKLSPWPRLVASNGSSLQATRLIRRSFARLCFRNANKITKEWIFWSTWPVALLKGRPWWAIQTAILHREPIHPLRQLVCTGVCVSGVWNVVATRLLTIAITGHVAAIHLLLVDISCHLLGVHASCLVSLNWLVHSSILCIWRNRLLLNPKSGLKLPSWLSWHWLWQ